MFLDLHAEVAAGQQSGVLDPYDLAAKYCHRFVNIHPFIDGNGRMCRLLANIICLKYAGHVMPFGGNQYSKVQYLSVAHRSSKRFHEEDMEVSNDDMKGHHELKAFMLQKMEENIGY